MTTQPPTKLVFFDIDQTLYNGYSTSGFYLYAAKAWRLDNWLTNKDKQITKLYLSGKIDYSEATVRVVQLFADVVKGRSNQEVTRLTDKFLKVKNRLFPYTKSLISLCRQHNAVIYLISAAASPIAEAIALHLEIQDLLASPLEIKNNIYTGQVTSILNNQAKTQAITKIINYLPNHPTTLAFGDSTGDADMLDLVDYPFLINPHQDSLIQLAQQKNWITVTNETIIPIVKSIIKE